jgi:hypothetical protein
MVVPGPHRWEVPGDPTPVLTTLVVINDDLVKACSPHLGGGEVVWA